MFSVETRGAAARRQSDRPPCIDDDSAGAPPCRCHATTSARRAPLGQLLALAVAGGVVLAALRDDLFDAAIPTVAHRAEPATTSVRPPANPGERFSAYFVSSFEEAELLRVLLGDDRAAIEVVASAGAEAAFREQVRQINAIRLQRGLGEVDIVDLRTVR